MYVFWMLIIGLLVGMGAGLVLHTRGYATAIALGIAGSCVAGFLGRAMGWVHGPAGAGGVTISIAGAIVALAVYAVLSRGAAGRSR